MANWHPQSSVVSNLAWALAERPSEGAAELRTVIEEALLGDLENEREREKRGGKNLRIVESFLERALVVSAIEDEHLG
ncbi:hypothetical protein, partial [Rhizobium sp. Root1203]|uniref:hypothetical protein n=1 Tax=Rhizobium sp. Root1203 TaxID=1736427 RepID=UPI001AED02EB